MTDDGVGESYAPNIIGFYGVSVRSRLGLVSTKNGYPVSLDKGNFAIDISMASQSFLTNFDNSVSIPLVEDILNGFIVSSVLYNEPKGITATELSTASGNLDLSDISVGQPIYVTEASAVINSISGAFDGQEVYIFLEAQAEPLTTTALPLVGFFWMVMQTSQPTPSGQ